MRLRLSVLRHRLPPANVLWSVPNSASPQAYTVAKLLEDVNAVLPLEAEQWGLEDYVVEVGGFECLHFSLVSQTLKDDDQVSIRPLLTAEVRSRTLCGRYQISDGGQHLVDGVPFGRPLLRTPSRPQIRIPPRKRQRLLDDDMVENEHAEILGLITAKGEVSCQQNGMDPSYGDANGGREETPQPKQRKTGKSVRFAQLPGGRPEDQDDDDDDDDDEDFALDEGSEDSDASMNSTSESETDDGSGDSNVSDSDSDSDSDVTSGSHSDSDSASGESTESEVSTPKRADANTNPPGKGLGKTKSRNERRKTSKRLNGLKSIGILPKDATLKDMRELTHKTNEPTNTNDVDSATCPFTHPEDTTTKKRKWADIGPYMEQPATERDSGIQVEIEEELQRRRQELMAQVSQDSQDAQATMPASRPATRRLRPNVDAISRMLSHQTRQAGEKPKRLKTAAVEEPQAPQDPGFWKSKINLTAFECWNEEYDLSAPPFPFKQHWDPNCKLMQKKGKQKQRKTAGERFSDINATTSDDGNQTIELDYGESRSSHGKSDRDTTTTIESQLLQDVAAASQSDLPPLPDNVDALPTLADTDIKKGALVVFKLFELNPANMNPEISAFKTAIVEEEGDSGNGAGDIGLKLAERDKARKEKKYNRKGERIYDHVDNFGTGDSDEEDTGGLLYYKFHELLEAKLLKGAEE